MTDQPPEHTMEEASRTAIHTLIEICQDKKGPKAHRVTAARYLLEVTGQRPFLPKGDAGE